MIVRCAGVVKASRGLGGRRTSGERAPCGGMADESRTPHQRHPAPRRLNPGAPPARPPKGPFRLLIPATPRVGRATKKSVLWSPVGKEEVARGPDCGSRLPLLALLYDAATRWCGAGKRSRHVGAGEPPSGGKGGSAPSGGAARGSADPSMSRTLDTCASVRTQAVRAWRRMSCAVPAHAWSKVVSAILDSLTSAWGFACR